MKSRLFLSAVPIISAIVLGCIIIIVAQAALQQNEKWRAVHLSCMSEDALRGLEENVPIFAQMGVNVLILEVNYGFEFESHPELRSGKTPITKGSACRFSELCRRHGIRLVPQFQCIGHQSWKENTGPLLAKYPELDLTPGAFPGNRGIFSREWDVLNPKVNHIVFRLMDELIDAFQADAFHVGMDEVFLLGNEHSPSTRGKDPGKLFAKAVNEYYDHLVKKRHVEMLMWGDRLIDGKKFNFGRNESSMNVTATAVDMIPKDIIICDWHYGKRSAYESIPMFIQKGFRVLPAGWNRVDATMALIKYSKTQKSPLMMGHLFTTWFVEKDKVTEYPPIVEGLRVLQEG